MKRVIVVFLALLLLSGLLFACTGSEKNGKKVDLNKMVEELLVPDTEHDYGGKSYRIMAWYDSTPQPGSIEDEAWKKIAEKYNIGKMEWVSVPDMTTYMNRLATDAAAGTAADMCGILHQRFSSVAASGLLSEITYDISKSPYYAETLSKSFEYNGKRYGTVTANIMHTSMAYNRDLILSIGNEDPMDLFMKDEWTWDKFKDMCIKVKNLGDDYNAFTSSWSLEWTSGLFGFLATNNSDMISIVDGKAVQTMDSANTMEALQFLYDLVHVDKVTSQDLAQQWVNNDAFYSGKVAFYIGGETVEVLKRDTTSDFIIATLPYPRGPKQKAEDYFSPLVGVNGWVYPINTTDPNGAVKVYEDICTLISALKNMDPDGNYDNEAYNETMKRGSGSLSDGALMRQCMTEDDFDALLKLAEKGKPLISTSYGVFPNSIIQEIMEAVISGAEPPSTAVAARKDELQDLIDRALKK